MFYDVSALLYAKLFYFFKDINYRLHDTTFGSMIFFLMVFFCVRFFFVLFAVLFVIQKRKKRSIIEKCLVFYHNEDVWRQPILTCTNGSYSVSLASLLVCNILNAHLQVRTTSRKYRRCVCVCLCKKGKKSKKTGKNFKVIIRMLNQTDNLTIFFFKNSF